jgi:hypothetical protein
VVSTGRNFSALSFRPVAPSRKPKGFRSWPVGTAATPSRRGVLRAHLALGAPPEKVSSYHLATETRSGWEGLEIMTEPGDGVSYATMSATDLATALRAVARRANPRRDRKPP